MTYNIFPCDCVDAMRHLMEAESVDSIVTDPPYELTSIVKRFGKAGSAPAQHGTDGAFARASRGFMGQTWDGSGIAFSVEMWAEAYRVLKPGGYLLAFSGSRTYHRMVCAIEDAGFEIRDQIMWLYGSGFPKSLDVSKAIDKAAGAEREIIGTERNFGASKAADGKNAFGDYAGQWNVTTPATDDARQWQGWGTALKPAHEPIVVARKPLAERTVAANVLRYGTGAINIDGCRVGSEGGTPLCASHLKSETTSVGGYLNAQAGEPVPGMGRFPANVIHDGSDEVIAAFPNTAGDSGNAARFFYAAKASKADRDEGLEHLKTATPEQLTGRIAGSAGLVMEGGKANPYAGTTGQVPRANIHPTVKPTNLMRYLCRLVTPPGGTVFDPFTGSGSTGKAAILEGFQFIGCEMTPEYVPIATARLDNAVNTRNTAQS
ncbi:MAG TPA: site-specific DNA-methyltransferase [Gammaproteobacteria bacterium]|nr:site-specific DNA-methyltransferase [Gammaproteobacteria bacterium]